MTTWDFAFDRVATLALRPFGVRSTTARVTTDAGWLDIEFGPWRLRTPLTNVAGAIVTGPYLWVKAIGPHLSLADRGVTFGSNARAGVCVCFKEPVRALLPVPVPRHPAATVTVADPEGLAAHLNRIAHP